jgi:hypothetical protein
LLDLTAARTEVQQGRAQWVKVNENDVVIPKTCPMCGNDDTLKKSCLKCLWTGTVLETVIVPVYGTDIVLSSEVEIREEKGVKREISRTAIAKRTPRVATIEKAHMERAYLFGGDQTERERIEAYGEMNKEFFDSLIVPFREDPTEGRLIFCFSPDERSKSTTW